MFLSYSLELFTHTHERKKKEKTSLFPSFPVYMNDLFSQGHFWDGKLGLVGLLFPPAWYIRLYLLPPILSYIRSLLLLSLFLLLLFLPYGDSVPPLALVTFSFECNSVGFAFYTVCVSSIFLLSCHVTFCHDVSSFILSQHDSEVLSIKDFFLLPRLFPSDTPSSSLFQIWAKPSSPTSRCQIWKERRISKSEMESTIELSDGSYKQSIFIWTMIYTYIYFRSELFFFSIRNPCKRFFDSYRCFITTRRFCLSWICQLPSRSLRLTSVSLLASETRPEFKPRAPSSSNIRWNSVKKRIQFVPWWLI